MNLDEHFLIWLLIADLDYYLSIVKLMNRLLILFFTIKLNYL